MVHSSYMPLVMSLVRINANSTVKKKYLNCLSEGWSIRRSELQLGKSIGKGEFGGENNIIICSTLLKIPY